MEWKWMLIDGGVGSQGCGRQGEVERPKPGRACAEGSTAISRGPNITWASWWLTAEPLVWGRHVYIWPCLHLDVSTFMDSKAVGNHSSTLSCP